MTDASVKNGPSWNGCQNRGYDHGNFAFPSTSCSTCVIIINVQVDKHKLNITIFI